MSHQCIHKNTLKNHNQRENDFQYMGYTNTILFWMNKQNEQEFPCIVSSNLKEEKIYHLKDRHGLRKRLDINTEKK